MRTYLIPGYNVDKLDIKAGLDKLKDLGYHELETQIVIEYALIRWTKGEEEAAQRMAIDKSFYGISLTCWYIVLAFAKAAVNN